MKISEILAKYDTDKVAGHCYGESYDELFSAFGQKDKLSILEVGVQKGGSMMAWKEYFPNSKVIGVDIVDVRKAEYIAKEIEFVLGDIKEVNIERNFDIIIDDGSHFFPDVEYVVKNFVGKLNTKGIMVIEDVQHPESWVYNVRRILPEGFTLEVKDLRNIQYNYDDFLIIIRKQ
jgi:trans-aconitate methyltransferase